MGLCLALILLTPSADESATPPPAAGDARFVVAGYLPSYRVDSWTASPGPLTDVIYFSATPTAGGQLPDGWMSGAAGRLRTLRESGVRVSVCVGGWGRSDAFASLVSSPAARRTLVDTLAALPIDGVDFDWEHPSNADEWIGYERLIRETKASDPSRLVTVAVAAFTEAPASLFDAADRVHLMSYDHAYPHATIEKTTADIDRTLAAGCPAAKLVVGVPFYGRAKNWTPTAFADLPPTPTDEDMTAEGIAFNNAETLRTKVRLAAERGLAGVVIWELGQDRADERSLLNVIEESVAALSSGPAVQ